MATQRGRRPASTRKTTGGRKTSRRRTQKQKEQFSAEVRDEVILLCAIAITILLFLCNFHIIGKAGNAVSDVMFGVFGALAYITPPLLLFAALFGIVNLGSKTATIKLLAGVVLFLVFEVFFALLGGLSEAGDTVKSYYSYGVAHKLSGGVLGGVCAGKLTELLGMVGTIALALVLMIVCMVLLTEKSFVKGIAGKSRSVYEHAREDVDRRIERNEELRQQRMQQRLERERLLEENRSKRMDHKVSGVAADITIPKKQKSLSRKKRDDMQEVTLPEDVEETQADTVMLDELAKIQIKGLEPVAEEETAAAPEIHTMHRKSHKVEVVDAPEEPFDMDSITSALEASADKMVQMDVPLPAVGGKETAGTQTQKATPPAQKAQAAETELVMNQTPPKPKPYRKPPLTLLKKSEKNANSDSEKQLRETAYTLKQTLKTFGVNVTITDISQGPAVTRYELQPEMGVKVSKIVNLADDIKLNLAATDIRIEAPIPGKAAIGIEVPNKENSAVLLRELLETKNFRDFKSNIAFAVGKDISGQTVVADIGKMPHVLIAGATGSGKSVCINTLIMSILYKSSPEDVKLIMIDPKVVELSVYNGIPHLMLPVVTDPKKAAAALHWGVNEMTERYKKFEDMHVRDLKGYNKKVDEMTENDGAPLPQKMPQIVIIVDELADLMMVAPGEVEESICRLAQLARAAGIHLVIATQRPSVDVITGLIKANMPSRCAFAVSSGVDSRTILDMNGAEKLLGKGDMLFYPQGYPKPVRIQGAFVSDKEVSDVVDYIREQNDSSAYTEDIESQIAMVESAGSDAGASKGASADEKDMYFADAGRFIIEKEKASIGMLQRVFKIGFNRAARIMDQLCEYGVVGEEEGTKPRKVLMTMEEFEQLLEEI